MKISLGKKTNLAGDCYGNDILSECTGYLFTFPITVHDFLTAIFIPNSKKWKMEP